MAIDDEPIDPDDFHDPHAERKEKSGLYAPAEFNVIKRGEEVNLTRKDPTLRLAIAALGWDLKKFDRDPPDLDASVFLLDRTEKTREDTDFVFYNSMVGCEGAVRHSGDSRTGAGEGDDETIILDLQALPFDIMKIVFVVSIYDLDMNENNFTHVKNVYFRLINQSTEQELLRYDLDEELQAGGTAIIVGEIERLGSDWIYRARGETVKQGLGKIAQGYGILVAQQVQG
jgi:tellurium resistance protein TerD